MWYFTCINATLHVKRLLLTVSCEVLTVSCEVFTMNFERETELVDVSNNSFESSTKILLLRLINTFTTRILLNEIVRIFVVSNVIHLRSKFYGCTHHMKNSHLPVKKLPLPSFHVM